MLLALLGVPDEAIVADYTLSERSLEPYLAWAEANAPEEARGTASLPVWLTRSPAKVMQAFLEMLRARHGSIDAYLTDIGVGHGVVRTLRRRLLTPTTP